MRPIVASAIKKTVSAEPPAHRLAVNRMEKVRIGGVDQWILIRGCHIQNPLLLFLHGGPGAAQIAFAPKFQTQLEKSFVVVNWDQRGAGKSFTAQVAKESMNLRQFIGDTHELTDFLLRHFHQKKLFLAAHSWGSIFGLKTVQQYPELFHAYIGIGQAVDMQQTAYILQRYNYDAARKYNNKKAFKQLGGMGLFPLENAVGKALLHIKWLEKFGGIFAKPSFKKDIVKMILSSKEYTLLEKLRYKAASKFSFNTLFDELIRVNLFKEIPEVKVPVYFCVGCHDYNTPFQLAEQFYKALKAPGKKLKWFGQSGHAPHFEEPGSFSEFVVSTVLSEAGSGAIRPTTF